MNATAKKARDDTEAGQALLFQSTYRIKKWLDRLNLSCRHRVLIPSVINQPLKERENFGFEYSGAKDPSRMVPALELTDEEVLERLQKMLKGASVVPLTVFEFCAKNPPLAVSCFLFVRVLSVFLLLYPFLLNFSCLVVLFFL